MFWGAWPKRTVLRVLLMKCNISFLLYRSRFFRIGSRFLADPDTDSEKSLIRIREKKRGSDTDFYPTPQLKQNGGCSPCPEPLCNIDFNGTPTYRAGFWSRAHRVRSSPDRQRSGSPSWSPLHRLKEWKHRHSCLDITGSCMFKYLHLSTQRNFCGR